MRSLKFWNFKNRPKKKAPEKSTQDLHRELVCGQILRSLTPDQADLIHMAMGVSSEAGELLDAVKKHAIYQKTLDRENVIEELGDLEFFLEGIRQRIKVSRDETLAANLKKLNVRYEKGTYSDQQAQARKDKG